MWMVIGTELKFTVTNVTVLGKAGCGSLQACSEKNHG
jgi:hypothetical protein